MTFLIFAIITMMVLVRYIFKTSSFGFEELPTYFLMISIWLGAVICSRDPKEGQIKIDFFIGLVRKKPLLRAIIDVITSCFSVSCIGLYTYLSWNYVAFCYQTKQTTLALMVPMWILTGLTFIACAFLLIYEIAILVKAAFRIRELREGRKAA